MSTALMTIGDRLVDGAGVIPVLNPATGERGAEAPDCSRAQLDEAMNAAEAAFRGWAHDEEARRDLLRSAAKVLGEATEEIAPILTAEHGQPLAAAAGEVGGAAFWLQAFADMDRPAEVLQDDEAARVELRDRPMGVVAAITPWNFPLILACWKLAPALRAGNTIVIKPSPFTPLSTLKMIEVLARVLPPGVVNAVSGGDDLGRAMSAHPIPRKISFTGSVAAGREVGAAAGKDLKRVTLELGGNDAAIVLDDVDVAGIAEKLFWTAFLNNGQACAAVKRLYVPRRLEREIAEALAAVAAAVPVGDGTHPDTVLGPINNAPQFERVKALVAGAVHAGGVALSGGAALDRPGYFFPPTILTGVAEGTAIVDEEQFGPALPVLGYDDVEEAIRRANDTTYGLGGSVWSPDVERAAELAERLECGTAWVNTHVALGPFQPFGGHKSSGIGLENGLLGLKSFSEPQVLHTAK